MFKLCRIDIFRSELLPALREKPDVCAHRKSSYPQCGIIGALKIIISTCFSYLSDYLQIKLKHTFFKSIFAFFNRGCRTFNRGCWAFNRGCWTFNRGCWTFNQGVNTLNRMRFILKYRYSYCKHIFIHTEFTHHISKSGKPFSFTGFT